jgi:predicted RNA binding protein YcfA (HicA-like mRNA interferase family)
LHKVRSRGSHVVMARSSPDAGRVVCVVPVHDEIAVGTLRGVLRQAGVLPDEFIAALRQAGCILAMKLMVAAEASKIDPNTFSVAVTQHRTDPTAGRA